MSIYIETVGSGKPSLWLLHGWGLNGVVWDSVRNWLTPHFTLHIVDLPGHGYSREVSLTTLEAAADLIADAIAQTTAQTIAQTDTPTIPQKIGKAAHILGWSLGGQIALAIAHRHPALVHDLILVGTTPCFISSEDWPYGKKTEVLDDFAKRLTDNYAATIRGFLALQTLNQPGARASVAALQAAMSQRGEPPVASLQAGLAMLRTNDTRGILKHIQHRTTVIQGDHDALTPPAAAKWMSQQLPNATYALMPHAAHAPFLSHRELFLEHIKNRFQ